MPPAITIITDIIISIRPPVSRVVRCSPNTITPHSTAVTGSKTPRSAVGVDPILCIDIAVQISDTAVGSRPSANIFSHRMLSDGNVISIVHADLPAKMTTPNMSR